MSDPCILTEVDELRRLDDVPEDVHAGGDDHENAREETAHQHDHVGVALAAEVLVATGRRPLDPYRRADEKPARNAMKKKSTTAAVRRLPRCAGERMPSAARTITIVSVQKTWTPVPTIDANKSGWVGGRNTSPWISFQPLSSTVSSRSSSVYVKPLRYGYDGIVATDVSRERAENDNSDDGLVDRGQSCLRRGTEP